MSERQRRPQDWGIRFGHSIETSDDAWYVAQAAYTMSAANWWAFYSAHYAVTDLDPTMIQMLRNDHTETAAKSGVVFC